MRGLLIGVVILTGCLPADSRPRERPSQVPEKAIWSGGEKGGNWFLCEGLEDPGLYDCTVYNDFTGEVEQSGVYKSPGYAVLEEPLEYGTFTGYNIILMDGVVLDPAFDPFPEDVDR